MDKIEFYKNRTLSERFSVSIDFLKQNWKILYKNILIGALPLALIAGYSVQYYYKISFNERSNSIDDYTLFWGVGIYCITLIAMVVFLNAMTGAVLKKYGKGELNSDTGWSDLKDDMFSLSGKTYLIGFILWGIAIISMFVVVIILALFMSGITSGGGAAYTVIIIGLTMFLLLGFILAFSPFLALAQYPAYYSEKNILESIKISFGMGFRNWGSVIITIILAGTVIYVVNMIFSIPNFIVASFHVEFGFLTFIFGFIAMLGYILTYPVFFVFMAFQYFSIVESEQGVSLQSKVHEFENL